MSLLRWCRVPGSAKCHSPPCPRGQQAPSHPLPQSTRCCLGASRGSGSGWKSVRTTAVGGGPSPVTLPCPILESLSNKLWALGG